MIFFLLVCSLAPITFANEKLDLLLSRISALTRTLETHRATVNVWPEIDPNSVNRLLAGQARIDAAVAAYEASQREVSDFPRQVADSTPTYSELLQVNSAIDSLINTFQGLSLEITNATATIKRFWLNKLTRF